MWRNVCVKMYTTINIFETVLETNAHFQIIINIHVYKCKCLNYVYEIVNVFEQRTVLLFKHKPVSKFQVKL